MKKPPWLFFLLPAFAGFLAVFWVTQWGIGLTPDSAIYISVARNLLRGNGFSMGNSSLQPLTHYPPLYPILIAGLARFSEPLFAGRLLHASLFACNIFLVGLLVYQQTKRLGTACLGTFFMLTAIDMLEIHAAAWSEPTFLFFSFLGIYLFIKYLGKKHLATLWLSGISIGLALLSRYAAIAWLATILIFYGMDQKTARKKKLREIGCFLSAAGVPLLFWVLRNFLYADTLTNRDFAFHPINSHYLLTALRTVGSWFLLVNVPPSLSILFWPVFLLLTWLFVQNLQGKKPSPLHCLLFTFISCYLVLLVFSISFLDASTPMNPRILSPIFAALLLIIFSTISIPTKNNYKRNLTYILLLTYAGFFLSRGISWSIYRRSQGYGYATAAWAHSETMANLKNIPAEIPIYSNAPESISLLIGKDSKILPSKIRPDSREDNLYFPTELAAMREDLEKNQGLVVYFKKISWRFYLPTENDLKTKLPLSLHAQYEDGSIYRIRTSN